MIRSATSRMDAAKLVQHQIKRSRPPIDVDPPDPPTIKETSTSPFPNPPSTAKNSRNISDPGRGSLNTLFKDQINNGNLEDEDISLLDKRAWKDFPEIWRSIYEPAKKPLGVDVIEMSREERDAFGALLKRERVRFALMRYRPPNGDIRDLLFKREGVGGECMEEGSLKFDSKGEKCGSKCGSPDRKEGPKGIRRVRRYDKRGMKLEVGSRDASGTDDEKHQLKPRLNSVPKCNVLPSPHDHKYNICKEMDSAKSHNLIASPTKNNKIDNIPSSALSALNAAVTPDSSSLSHVLQSRSIDAASNNHFALLHSDPDKHDKLLDLFFHSILQLVPGQIPHVFKVVCSEVYSISGVYVLSLGTVTEEAGGKRYPRYKREDKAERKSDSDFSTSYWLDMDIWSKDGGWIIWMERTHKVNGLQYESTILAYDTSLTRSLHPGLAVLKQWAARTDVEETYQSIKCGAIIAMRAVCGTLSMKPTKNEDLYCGRTVRGVITCEGKPKYLEDEGQSCQIVRDGISKTSPKETRVEMRAACIVTAFFQEQNRRCCEMHKQPGFVSSDKRACCFSYLGFKSEQEYRAYRAHQFHFCSGEYPGCLMLLDQDTRIKIMEFYKSFLRRGLREGNGERHVDDLLKWGAAEVRRRLHSSTEYIISSFLTTPKTRTLVRPLLNPMKKTGNISERLAIRLHGPKVENLQPRIDLMPHGVGLFERSCSIVDGHLDLLKKRLKFPCVYFRKRTWRRMIDPTWFARCQVSGKQCEKDFHVHDECPCPAVAQEDEFQMHRQAMEKAICIADILFGFCNILLKNSI